MSRKEAGSPEEKGIHHPVDQNGREIRCKPWLANCFSFVYDFAMLHSVFPRKFDAHMDLHCDILRNELKNIHGKRILELATGSGSAVHFLPNDNFYTGTDISRGLLRKAMKRFQSSGFPDPEFYLTEAERLPFPKASFDLCLCILSLNFFNDLEAVMQSVHQVLVPGSPFLCCVPVPERNLRKRTIRGKLLSEPEWEKRMKRNGFLFEPLDLNNGALFYFKGIRRIR